MRSDWFFNNYRYITPCMQPTTLTTYSICVDCGAEKIGHVIVVKLFIQKACIIEHSLMTQLRQLHGIA